MWSPEQYERFKSERRQPFDDLLALVRKQPRMQIVDLGCGTGELTRELHEALGAEETIGIDNSETMLLKAGHFEGQMLRFERGEIESLVTDRPYDLVFSNAAIQWVPDHERLLTRLTGVLSASGQLAIQMPANDSHPSHQIAAELGEEMGVRRRPDYLLRPEHYAELLHHLGFREQHVRMQVYGHLLPSSDDVVEWVRGALLTHYESSLEAAQWETFLERYRTRVNEALGNARPYFYTYKRILFWAAM